MAGLEQLNSFIGKFVNLWQTGFDASLELKTFNGEASVHFHVGLGQAHCLQKAQPRPHHHVSPSRVRRRARRAEARRQAAEEAAKVEAEHVARNEGKKLRRKQLKKQLLFMGIIKDQCYKVCMLNF